MIRYEKRYNKIKVDAWLRKLFAHRQRQKHSLDTTRLQPRYSTPPPVLYKTHSYMIQHLCRWKEYSNSK